MVSHIFEGGAVTPPSTAIITQSTVAVKLLFLCHKREKTHKERRLGKMTKQKKKGGQVDSRWTVIFFISVHLLKGYI